MFPKKLSVAARYRICNVSLLSWLFVRGHRAVAELLVHRAGFRYGPSLAYHRQSCSLTVDELSRFGGGDTFDSTRCCCDERSLERVVVRVG